jgi:HTH-type transcriptional regulator/antitoxin HigA
MNNRVSAEVFPPGEFLKKELVARGWSQIELSEILARPPRVVSEIISAKRAITPETAKGLAAALGTSPELWMNLESDYQLSKTTFESSKVQRRARLYDKFPVKEMIRRGWVPETKDMDRLERAFCDYFSISSIDEAPTFEHAAKKHRYTDPPEVLQLAWLIRAEQVAKSLKVGKFSVGALRKATRELRECLNSAEDVRRVPAILATAGVRFVVVKYLPSAKLDGACFWINGGNAPVVALSLRLDRLDNFWHSLFHEIDHILNGEGKQTPIVDMLEVEDAARLRLPREEIRANQLAAEYCVEKEAIDTWIVQTAPDFSRRKIVLFAKKMRVHPALVVGQLQYRGVIPYSFHRELLEPVRSLVLESTYTDGFNTGRGI